jgi:uncharacterized protein YodC (DUF2158 family)
MKKLLVIAVALASVNAFATRARVNALGNSPHLIDTQTVYSNPADMFFVGGDYVTLESGKTAATTTNDGAEGMVVRSWGDAKAGLSLGHDSDIALTQRGLATALFPSKVNYTQQNPIELSYGMKAGDLAWAGTFIYSNYKSKTGINEKEDTMGLRGGMRMGALDAKLGIGLANNYANDTDGKFKGTISISAGAGYAMDNLYFDLFARTSGYKTENAAGTETSKMDIMTIDARVTSSHKKDGSEFFYGAGLSNASYKKTTAVPETKTTSLNLPVWMGLEVDANSWMTLRGSITQSVLLNDSKTESTPVAGTDTEFSPGKSNTTVSVGTGFKFNKVTFDASLEGLTGSTATQQVNGTSLLGSAGLTYMF